jgi:predicted Zn-dependent protease
MAVTRRILAGAALPAACLLAACGTGEPAPPTPEITQEDRDYGAEHHPQLLGEFGGAYAGPQAQYVRSIGERIAQAAGLEGECTFTLVNSDVVNAFAVPGCYIYLTRGLMAVVTSEAELASVLGHEVGHIVAEHSQRQEQRSVWRRLGVIAVSLTGSERLTQLAGQAAQYFGLRYSRRQEYQADDLGVGYLRAAGYDVYAAAEMLADLQRQERFMQATDRRDAARSIPEWALSHPLTENRIERARETARKTGLKDDALPENADGFLTRVDGLLYGDDPEQGFVIGRRFAHPMMRIGFEAPTGFSLTNSPQAVGLNGPQGLSGEFGGGAIPAGGLKVYAEALASAIVGDTPAQIDQAVATRINGLPAVLLGMRVAVRDGSIPLSIAAYDGGGGEAYHFIVVSPPGNPQGSAVTALFQSFRRLTAQEAATLRPRVIRTVRVAAGETPDTLARRMADPAPKALFELLNGREDGKPVGPGELVKIVTYRDGR